MSKLITNLYFLRQSFKPMDGMLSLITANIDEFKNKTLNEIYPNNDWIMTGVDFGISIYDEERPSPFPFKYEAIYMNLIQYKCVATKKIGYTWGIDNNSSILHPFFIPDHSFEIVDIDMNKVNYKCKKCNSSASKTKNTFHKQFTNPFVDGLNFAYNCDELVIKNILE